MRDERLEWGGIFSSYTLLSILKKGNKKKQNDNPRNLKFLDGDSAFLYGEHLSQTSIFKKSGSSYSKNRDLVSPK